MVDSKVVLPEEMESLTIEPGADKVTLVTCTPYGVNDHRLLVHCVRTKYSKKDVDKQKSLAGRHWGKREFAVPIVVVAIVLLLCFTFAPLSPSILLCFLHTLISFLLELFLALGHIV